MVLVREYLPENMSENMTWLLQRMKKTQPGLFANCRVPLESCVANMMRSLCQGIMPLTTHEHMLLGHLKMEYL